VLMVLMTQSQQHQQQKHHFSQVVWIQRRKGEMTDPPISLTPEPINDPRLERLDDQIAELVAEAIYAYLLRQGSQNSLDTDRPLRENKSK